MVKGFFLTILTAFTVLAVYLFFYLGFYRGVEIARETRPELNLLFKPHLGAYHQIGGTFKEVEDFARERKLDCTKTFGEFIDDPSAVDQDRLRSHIGCLLPAPLADGPEKPFVFETRPAGEYAVARFKGAPSIGPMKVYPKMQEYLQEQRLKPAGPVIEVYIQNGGELTTEYLFPIGR